MKLRGDLLNLKHKRYIIIADSQLCSLCDMGEIENVT